ncbi:MAG TPA: enoyl-CoA hydratase/isomerase family protein [Kiloniellales bacterium]|nr:enoyl-CoA hydratase/isomerase family protein [Kiloniellales bacterium]
MSSELLVERKAALTVLTLNRPDRLNALNASLVEALMEALRAAAADGTRLCVFRGSGKGFSGGFDFGGLDEMSDGDLVLRFLRIEQLLQAVWSAPFSTLALVHGACFGAAADLVSSCSRRIATPDARFRMPGLRFGVVLGTRRLAAVVGMDKARRLLESSSVFDASQALENGFLQELAEVDAWPEVTERVSAETTALPPAAQRALLAETRDERSDADLAALARSVAEPGLRARMQAYLEEVRSKR